MSEPELAVSISDTEFTIGELQQFLDTARAVDGIPGNCLVAVTHSLDKPPVYTLTASSAFRKKYSDD
jgi:hypothetical protein